METTPIAELSTLSAQARRITVTLFLVLGLGSAGIIANATVNPIAAASLGGNTAWAGVPTAVYLFGSALAALAWGYLMDRLGRRGILLLGLASAVLGLGVVVSGILLGRFVIFLGGFAFVGVGYAAVQLGRFAAAEIHPPQARGRAISNVVLGGTVGAILGPALAPTAGRWVSAWGFNELAGPYTAALCLYLLALALAFVFLRPEPRQLARQIEQFYPQAEIDGQAARRTGEILRQPLALAAVATMVIAQAVMVMLMGITSLHMKMHDHGLGSIALVISSHTFGMYAFSIFSGQLADRWGRRPVILVGAVTLALSCLMSRLSPDVLPLGVALFLLGLGWNFCFVGGSTLLADQLLPAERGRIQGINDLLIGLASALVSLVSGVAFTSLGYNLMGLVGAALSLIPLGLAWRVGKMAALDVDRETV